MGKILNSQLNFDTKFKNVRFEVTLNYKLDLNIGFSRLRCVNFATPRTTERRDANFATEKLKAKFARGVNPKLGKRRVVCGDRT